MIITAKARYGLRLMADVASHEGACQLSAVSKRQQIGLAYLRQLSLILSRAGFLTSSKGRGGGVSRPADTITLGELFSALDGEICVTPPAENESPYAKVLRENLYEKVDAKLKEVMGTTKLSDLVAKESTFQSIFVDRV